MIESLFVFSLMLNQFSEGATEGYTWDDSKQRRGNKLICGRKGKGDGILDYHAWRLLENAGIAGAVLMAPMVDGLLQHFVGGWLVANFLYERSLNYVDFGILYPEKPPYHILGYEIPRKWWFDFIVLFAGMGVLSL